MREKLYCIYDESEKYAIRLADYINRRHLMPRVVSVYTSESAIKRDIDKYEVELLMLVNGINAELLDSINAEVTVYLTDEHREGNYVNPYQPADNVVKEVMSYMSDVGVVRNVSGNKCRINCIYSPVGKCFKTTFALMLAIWSSRKGRSLYINLEQFSGLGNLLSNKEGGLSEALYHYKVSGRKAIGRIVACTGQLQGMDYLYPVTCAEDIAELNEKEFTEFLNSIVESGVYEYVWIDVGSVYTRPWRLMEMCDRIFMPDAHDYAGRQKISEMENYLIISGRTELLERIEKIVLPFEENIWGKEISVEYISRADNGNRVNKILEERNCG